VSAAAELPARLRAVPPPGEVNEVRAYTVEEAAALLVVSPSFIKALCREGRLRHHYLGKGRGLLRIRHPHLVAYLESCEF
jgi:excisionase family DNA binding protein